MRRSYPRILALDDGFFPPSYKGGRGRTVLAGVLYGEAPLSASLRLIVVDGRDATLKASDICRELVSEGLRPDHVFTDGVTCAGFNYLDLHALSGVCGTPVTAVFRYKPDPSAIRAALRKHFDDYWERWGVIGPQVEEAFPLETRRGVVYAYTTLSDPGAAVEIISGSQVYSPVPEPLRVADMVASAAARTLLKAGRI